MSFLMMIACGVVISILSIGIAIGLSIKQWGLRNFLFYLGEIERHNALIQLFVTLILIFTFLTYLYANSLSRQSLDVARAAWISCSGLRVEMVSSDFCVVFFDFKNTSNIPAFGVICRIEDDYPSGVFQQVKAKDAELNGATWYPNTSYDAHISVQGETAKKFYDAVNSGSVTFCVTVNYHDVAGRSAKVFQKCRLINGVVEGISNSMTYEGYDTK